MKPKQLAREPGSVYSTTESCDGPCNVNRNLSACQHRFGTTPTGHLAPQGALVLRKATFPIQHLPVTCELSVPRRAGQRARRARRVISGPLTLEAPPP